MNTMNSFRPSVLTLAALFACLVTFPGRGAAQVNSASGKYVGKVVTSGKPAKAQLYTDPKKFKVAIQHLGTSTVVDFNEVAAPPGNTYLGRTPFSGDHYQSRGVQFASPHGHPLFIAPGGSSWNASNSLSVGRFPFDPNQDAALNDDDALEVTLTPSCLAVGFTMVDLDVRSPDESVQFFDAHGVIVGEALLPPNFGSNRAFIGIVSRAQPIARIVVNENANDGDDLDYDDFILVRPLKAAKPSSIPVNFHACFVNSGSVASAGPCVLPPGSLLTVHMSKNLSNPPATLMFKAALAHGVPASVSSPLSGSGQYYSTAVPAALCAAGTGGKWEIFLLDSTGQLWGNIGRLTADCRAYHR